MDGWSMYVEGDCEGIEILMLGTASLMASFPASFPGFVFGSTPQEIGETRELMGDGATQP
jgi:hypothetical protein